MNKISNSESMVRSDHSTNCCATTVLILFVVKLTLLFLQFLQTLGLGPIHILVDKNLGYAFISNYWGGSFQVHSVDKKTGEFDLKYTMLADYGKGDFLMVYKTTCVSHFCIFTFKLLQINIWHFC